MGVNRLESGEPCLRYGCALCCHNTKMPLTRLDINRITKLGYQISDFAEKVDHEWRLRNINGKCFFLNEEGRCKIYKYRPYGCRLYPLVYNWKRRETVLDDLCPYKDEFRVRKEDVKMLMLILKVLGEIDRF